MTTTPDSTTLSASAASGGAVRLLTQLPDPGRLWIRFSPRGWPGPATPWTDLAGARLGFSRDQFTARVDRALDDVLYLPPVPPNLEGQRLDTACRRLADGTPLLIQIDTGGELPEIVRGEGPLAGATLVFDLLAALLEGDLDRLSRLPPGHPAVWPLIAGLTDDPELWRRGCEKLAASGLSTVQAMSLTLTPSDRRWLLEGHEEAFDALFHGATPAEQPFAAVAGSFGLTPFLHRPLPRPPMRAAARRELAGALTLTADLWLRLGRAASRGLALARAAHWVDGSTYDVAALAREKNLGVIPEIDEGSRRLIEEWANTGKLALLDELEKEYVAG